MFTFERLMNPDTFQPGLRRSDGVVFYIETLQDMKALGFDVDAMMNDPNETGEIFTKVVEGRELAFYRNGQRIHPQKGRAVNVPQAVIDKVSQGT